MTQIICSTVILGFLALFTFVNSKAVHHDPSLEIINGREAVPHSAPHIVYLVTTGHDSKTWACGGSIINDQYVLTAKHCVEGGNRTTLYFGKHNLAVNERSQVYRRSSNYISHPSADIALIKFSPSLIFNEAISSIPYPSANDRTDYTGRTVIARGWGLISDAEEETDVLMEVRLPVISLPQCNRELQPFGWRAYDDEICTSGAGIKGTCQGDSGGPLVANDSQTNRSVLIGVTSWGPPKCEAGAPSVYVSTQVYSTWIRQNSV